MVKEIGTQISGTSIRYYRRMTINKIFDIWRHYVSVDCLASPAELKRLGEHKYSAVDDGFLSGLFLRRWWEWVVQWCPMWVAPNLITLVGLIINLITVMVLSTFSYSATEPAPSWAYLQAAFGLFLYQTLDAIDGKQARRTGSSSPLGELFDHGCDSMTQVFVTLNICFAMSLGLVPGIVIAVSLLSITLFYCAHWETYCTGTMRFSKFDVTEAQLSVISVLLTSAICGNEIWSTHIVSGFQLRHLVIGLSSLATLNQLSGYLGIVFSGGAGKNGSTIAGTSVIFPLFPLLMIIIPFLMIYSKSNTPIYDDNVTLFMLCLGAVGAKTTNRLVIAHMSKSELRLWDYIYLGPLTLMLNQYYACPIDELCLLKIVTVYCYASLLVFCTYVCQQFCEHLNIYCFTLGARKKQQ